MYTKLQHIEHVIANKGAPRSKQKRFNGKPWPSPRTALDELKRRAQAAAAEARRAFESMFEFVPQAQWDADMAEHLASLDANPDALTPPQQRALDAMERDVHDR